ncbi:MAG: hypothetical protein KGO50_09850 [Myxococcales bacterium]|nr:hypothetical protein [Myxococcales bacterium]
MPRVRTHSADVPATASTPTRRPNLRFLAICATSIASAMLLACTGPDTVSRSQHAPLIPPDAPTGIQLQLQAIPGYDGGGLLTQFIIVDQQPLAQPFLIAIPSVWAGRTDFDQDIRSIEVLDTQGDPLPWSFDEQQQIRVDTRQQNAIVLRYTLRPRHRILTEASRFRALMTSEIVYAPGHALLMQPISAGTAALQNIDLQLVGSLPVRSTAPPGGPWSMETLIDAAFFSGHYMHEQRPQLDVFVEPGAVSNTAAFADLIHSIVQVLQPIVGSDFAPNTTALVLSRQDDPLALSGHGRGGGFVLELGASIEPQSAELVRLVGHEHLHRLIGHGMRFDRDEELQTLWFREGLTEYLAVSSLVRAGLLAESELFAHIGQSITNLRTNPAAQSDAPEAGQYWNDRDLRRLPYDRGALLAMLMELQLLEHQHVTLGDFLAWMRQDPTTLAEPLTNASICDAYQRFMSLPHTDWCAAAVAARVDLPLAETLADAGLQIVERLEPAPFHGFRANMTAEGNWYVSDVVPGGPAERAGLAVGMQLAEPPELPAGRSPRPAWVRVETPAGEQSVMIEPENGQRRTHVLVEDSQRQGEWRLAFGLADPR